MDDGWGAGVKEEQPPQDLPAPAPDHLRLDGLQPTHVTARLGRGGRGERGGGGGRREEGRVICSGLSTSMNVHSL